MQYLGHTYMKYCMSCNKNLMWSCIQYFFDNPAWRTRASPTENQARALVPERAGWANLLPFLHIQPPRTLQWGNQRRNKRTPRVANRSVKTNLTPSLPPHTPRFSPIHICLSLSSKLLKSFQAHENPLAFLPDANQHGLLIFHSLFQLPYIIGVLTPWKKNLESFSPGPHVLVFFIILPTSYEQLD